MEPAIRMERNNLSSVRPWNLPHRFLQRGPIPAGSPTHRRPQTWRLLFLTSRTPLYDPHERGTPPSNPTRSHNTGCSRHGAWSEWFVLSW